MAPQRPMNDFAGPLRPDNLGQYNSITHLYFPFQFSFLSPHFEHRLNPSVSGNANNSAQSPCKKPFFYSNCLICFSSATIKTVSKIALVLN